FLDSDLHYFKVHPSPNSDFKKYKLQDKNGRLHITFNRLVNVWNARETSTLTLDSSTVSSRGAGLSKAFVGQKSNFTVDCSKAGKEELWYHYMLLVGVHGPQVPCEEVLVKHVGNLQYNVSYVLKERGNYILVVKWGEDHIPGSPFHVTVP
uniref:Uncharacterized protein n=1 Tax=Oreochromis aureus TaxID=47969 RepID=A0AAZ1XZL7_OREAU